MEKIEWLGHDSFRIKAAGKAIYIDPWKLARGEKADLILVTHDHFDHYSKDDIEKVSKAGTEVFVGSGGGDGKKAMPGDKFTAKGFSIETVRAYNLNKFRAPGQPFHPKEYNGVGFIMTIEGRRIYHAGDTDFIPEMKELGEIDVAMLPVSGTYVMTADEAAEAARVIKPKLAIPMHYGTIVGSRADAEKFKRLCENSKIKTEIL